MDGWAADGWLRKTGNKYFTILIDSSFYTGVDEWHQFNLDTPLRNGGQLWAYTGGLAVEPFLFYASEFEIKYSDQGVKSWRHEPYPEPFSNPENIDLYEFFGNDKISKPKADREKKLKDKKDKEK